MDYAVCSQSVVTLQRAFIRKSFESSGVIWTQCGDANHYPILQNTSSGVRSGGAS